MSLQLRWAKVAVGLSMTTLLAGPAMAQTRPAASELVAKYVAAIGGEAEVKKITSIKQIGAMELPAMGLSMSMEVNMAAPNKMSSKTTIPGMGEILSGYNGTVAWDVNPMSGTRVLAGKELTVAAENADFYGSLLYIADRFSSMETVGDTTINGEKAWAVKMVRKSSQQESFTYFSQTSGLIVGGKATIESQGGAIPTSQTVSGYKKFGAVLIPTKIEMAMGPQNMVMNLTDVQINGAAEAAFAVPEQVKPLIKP